MSSIPASIRRAASIVGRAIVDTVYPKICAGCGMRGVWLCDLCDEGTLALDLPGVCARCGVPLINGRCRCVELSPAISQVRSVAVYDGWVAAAVKRVKYDSEPDRTSDLAGRMVRVVTTMGPIDGLVPVPLHKRKERHRGYNQSLLLANHISESTGIPVMNVLVRSRHTESQTRLSGRERWENVADVFELDPTWRWWTGQNYLLIDDVRTTGATLSACARTLATASPDSISALTFALDLQKEELTAYRDYVMRIRRGGMPSPL